MFVSYKTFALKYKMPVQKFKKSINLLHHKFESIKEEKQDDFSVV